MDELVVNTDHHQLNNMVISIFLKKNQVLVMED
jgi:hypothetical protein